jgi:hypothetical protein
MPNRKGAFTLILNEPWNGMLEDFCEVFYKGQKTEVIRRALEFYIPYRLSTAAEESERYERLQSERRDSPGKVVRLVTPDKEQS